MAEGTVDAEGIAATPESDPVEQQASLQIARIALERGDYGQVLRQLEPLCARESGRSPLGGEVRILMATALLGQGQPERATSLCRQLRGCTDAELRRQARDLEEVLQAPGLERPKEWSLTLPSLGTLESTPSGLQSVAARRRRRRKNVEDPPPPPVGRTRAPIGFAVAVTLVLVLLTTLLGGCIRISTDVAFPAPGRLQISEELSSRSGLLLPWQRQLPATLEEMLAKPGLRQVEAGPGARPGHLVLQSSVLPARQALDLIAGSIRVASGLVDLPLPAPTLHWHEQNWLIGVQQQLSLELDLDGLQPLPGLELTLVLEDTSLRAIRIAEPQAPEASQQGVVWSLTPGTLNRLELRCWRWSRLGLGTVGVALLLPAALLLQRQRRQAGFGWPELPA